MAKGPSKERARRERARQERERLRLLRRREGRPRQPKAVVSNTRVARAPPMAGDPDKPARFLHERARRWVLWADESRDDPTPERVRDLINSGRLKTYKDDPVEASQELAYESLESEDSKQAHELAIAALRRFPGCADARRVIAAKESRTSIDRVGWLKKALTDEEERLGPSLLEFAGCLSDAVECWPYLRVRFDLAAVLFGAGRQKRARTHFRALLDADSDDMLGARYPLLMIHLVLGEHEEAGEILDNETEDQTELIVRWARVLERVQAGKLEEAEALYAELRDNYQSEADSLSSEPPAEFPAVSYFRDEIYEYAALCLHMLHYAWHGTDVGREWFLAHATKTPDA